jgi:3-methyladenine DNA glycosylase/8-oxoguanine DNA glycosylase
VRPIAPFRLDLTVWALRRRRRNAIDRWDGVTYRRIDGHTAYAFPAPHDVAWLPPSSFQAVGFSRQKVRALLALARGIDRHTVDLAALSHDGDDTVRWLRQGRPSAGHGIPG